MSFLVLTQRDRLLTGTLFPAQRQRISTRLFLEKPEVQPRQGSSSSRSSTPRAMVLMPPPPSIPSSRPATAPLTQTLASASVSF